MVFFLCPDYVQNISRKHQVFSFFPVFHMLYLVLFGTFAWSCQLRAFLSDKLLEIVDTQIGNHFWAISSFIITSRKWRQITVYTVTEYIYCNFGGCPI